MPENEVIKHVMDIKESLGTLEVKLSENTFITKSVELQAIKTNGRVSKLEDEYISVKEILAEQVHINSKINGAIIAHRQWIEQEIANNTKFAKREINELKKTISKSVDSKLEFTQKKALLSEETKGKIKIGIWSTIGAAILSFLGWVFQLDIYK